MTTTRSQRPSQRDPRVDFLRGCALLTIFVDHVPGNTLGLLTLRNFGFCDAAELFVVLAGFSSMAAYGRCFDRDGMGTGLRRIAARCLRLYLFQAALLLATLGIVAFWTARYGPQLPDLVPFLSSGAKGLRHSLELKALPPALDILPLYIVLLALFPLIYLAVRRSPALALTISGLVWLAANIEPGLNFTNRLDGRGWFFNPFAWQLLFVIGAVGRELLASRGGSPPRIAWLTALCWAYLGFALLAAAPWAEWGWWDFRPIVMDTPDKTNLSALRLVDLLALIYLALSTPGFGRLARSRWLAGVEICGKHSLEIFSLGTLLALTGRLAFSTLGTGWTIQLAVDGIGFGLMLITAAALEYGWPRGRIVTPRFAPERLAASGASAAIRTGGRVALRRFPAWPWQ